MRFGSMYRKTSKTPETGSILEFFGYHFQSEEGTRLRKLKHGSWEKVGEDTYEYQERTVGFTSDKTGFYENKLERLYPPTGKKLELETKFIQSVKAEGKDPFSDDFIWGEPRLCTSVDDYYNIVTSSVWPRIIATITGILALIAFGMSFYQYYLARNAGLPTGEYVLDAVLTLLGGVAVTILVYWLFSLLFQKPPLCKLSQKKQEEICAEYLDNLGSRFSGDTGAILKEYAILQGYHQVRTTKVRNKWFSFFGTVAAIAVALVLFFEVLTVKVYTVTEVATESHKIVYEYDHMSRIRQIDTYDNENNLIESLEYVYDDRGNAKSSTRYVVKNGEKSVISGSIYNTNGFYCISSEVLTDAHGNETSKIYFYRNFLNIITEESEYIGKNLQRRSTFEHKNQLLTRRVDFVGAKDNERETAVYEYTYDKKGNLTGSKVFSEGILADEIICSYDGRNRLTWEKFSYDSNGQVTQSQKTEYEYDSNGNLAKYTEYVKDVVDSYSIVTCDENGNISQVVSYYESGEPTGATTGYQYRACRMRVTRAKRLLLERAENTIFIDFGWF